MNKNNIFVTQVELLINNNLYKKGIVDEEVFLKVQDLLLVKLKRQIEKDY